MITCFTSRRHNRSRVRTTPVGRFEFVCVSRSVYAPPIRGVVAGPEQALCDFVHVMRHRGIDPGSQYTFRNLAGLGRRVLTRLLRRYPASVARNAQALANS